jgi:hypothetical protein
MDAITRAGRCDRAASLAAIAVLGLVVTPLLHAEQHCREEHRDAAEAVAEAWRAGSTDPLEKLAFALAHVHHAPAPAEQHGHGHSHGPDGKRPHGDGAIAHLGAAIHAPPPAVQLSRLPSFPTPPAAMVAQRHGTLRYLVSEWPQGPPAPRRG